MGTPGALLTHRTFAMKGDLKFLRRGACVEGELLGEQMRIFITIRAAVIRAEPFFTHSKKVKGKRVSSLTIKSDIYVRRESLLGAVGRVLLLGC